MTPQRQKQILAVLALVLVGVVAVRTLPMLKSSGSTSGRSGAYGSSAGQAPVAAGPLSSAEIVDLRFTDLEQKPGEYQPGRDPFRFQPKPRPQPVVPPPPPPPKPQPVKKPQPRQAQAPPRPRPPEPTFKFLGSFGPEEKRVAVFSDSTEIFNVIEGDVFMEAFVVRKIGYESADIGWVNFPDEPARRLAAGG